MYRESAALLARLGHEAIPVRAKVGRLRPAAQQIVSIARALSRDVRLLIMDEPSAILDDAEITTLFEVVRRLTAEGVGVVYISHRLDEIRTIGDRVTVLADGRTTATRHPGDDADRRARRADGRATRSSSSTPTARVGTDRVVLEVRDLKRLPDVRGVSLEVRAGEVVGLGGLVGSGRTELLRLDLRARPAGRGRGARRGKAAARRTGPTSRSGEASGSPPRTASRRRSCSTGAGRRT